MSASRMTRWALVLTMLAMLLCTLAGQVMAQEHGRAFPNTGNDVVIVEGDADNPLSLKAGYGFVLVREEISFANNDPNLTTDYGVMYIPPEFEMESLFPRVTYYAWEFNVASYTVRLYNATRGFVADFPGLTSGTFELQPGDLNPNTPGEDDPRVNTTYLWYAVVVDTRGEEIINLTGGQVTTNSSGPTVFDIASLDPPPIGQNNHMANTSELVELTFRLSIEPYVDFTDGFYKMYISGMTFQYGMSITIEVRYREEIEDSGLGWDKLVFTQRPVDIDVYLTLGMEVKMFEGPGDNGPQLSPMSRPTSSGTPTTFHTDTTFHIVIQAEGLDEIDWGLYGRYAALAGVILLLLFLLLWSGPQKRGEEAPEGEGDGVEGTEVAEDEEAETREPASKVRSKTRRTSTSRREELEVRKAQLLKEMRNLDALHDAGDLPTREWKIERADLKAEAVQVMKELERLESEEEA